MSKILKVFFVFVCLISLAGCNVRPPTEENLAKEDLVETGSNGENAVPEVGQETKEGSGSRPMMGQESFGVDVCNDAPSEWVAAAINKEIFGTRDYSTSTNTGCEYYLDAEKKNFVAIVVNYLEFENQKKGQEALGRKMLEEGIIPMENFVAIQEDGNINAIYLVMAPEKFVRVDRSSGDSIDNPTLLSLAVKLASEKILN